MFVRRCAHAICRMTGTIIVAVVVALTVPVSQLQTVSTVTTCCCPDPANCHCPDHEPRRAKAQSSIRPCHKASHANAASQRPSFVPPDAIVFEVAPRIRALFAIAYVQPHPAPAPPRLAAPS